ncbi:MAG: caspase family protein [Sterolibacterium sp.]|jgi:hypothetical protein|nr:caspase family protein [Sterolibacterium sp.]
MIPRRTQAGHLALLTTATVGLLAFTLPSHAAEDPVTTTEINEIRTAFKDIGLRQANVELGGDGRVSLVGEYENRDEVETAFSAARAVVGLRRVAPTTPSNIKYRLKGFDNAFSSTIARMMQKPAAAPSQQPAQPTAAQTVTAPPPRSGPQNFGLVIGVGKFKYLPADKALEGAEKDATGVYNLLISPEGGLPRDHVRLLTQEQATSTAIKAAMQEVLNKTQSGDTVVFFIASHGLPNAMNKFDVILYDTEFPRKKAGKDGFEFVVTNRATALSDDEFQKFISQLTLKNVRTVIVLDTCYSGKTFAAVPGFLSTRTRSLVVRKKEAAYTTSMPQEAMSDLAQQAKDLKTSRIVIVSASEDEESLEAPELGGGAFTQSYIKLLRQIHDYADAFDKAKPTVIRFARTVGRSQTPRMLVVPEEAVTKM